VRKTSRKGDRTGAVLSCRVMSPAAKCSAILACLVFPACLASCAALVDLQDVPYGSIDSEASTESSVADASSAPPQDAVAGPEAAPKPTADVDASACGVQADGKLHCTNRIDSPVRAEPKASAPIVNTLRTTSSYFLCWGAGELHAGGNTTWYYTVGDDNPNLGWVPAVLLYTPDAFDANPSAFGLRNCSN
jgi:hypothetical protein